VKVLRLKSQFVSRLAVLALAVLACLTLVQAAYTQAPAAAPVTDGVRVIDIKYIFQHHNRYKAAADAMKQEFEAAAQRLKEERTAIMNLEKQVKDLVPNSPDAKRLDDELVRRKTEWNIQSQKQQSDFQSRSAEMSWHVYSEIQAAVQQYCRQNNVGLVLQFNGDPVDTRRPDKIGAAMGRSLVYVAPNRDITPYILEMLRNPPPGNPVNNQPIGVPVRPASAPGQF
jgi:Skp family chaperone for outer membrane proteins